jgi:hypothetical protein
MNFGGFDAATTDGNNQHDAPPYDASSDADDP